MATGSVLQYRSWQGSERVAAEHLTSICLSGCYGLCADGRSSYSYGSSHCHHSCIVVVIVDFVDFVDVIVVVDVAVVVCVAVFVVDVVAIVVVVVVSDDFESAK